MQDPRPKTEPREPGAASRVGWWNSTGLILIIAVSVVMLIVAGESVVALAVVLMEGGPALAVLASAAGAGGWVAQLLGPRHQPWPHRLVIGAALGIGTLSLIVLGLGSAGVFSRPVAFSLVGALAVAGLIRLGLDLRKLTPRPVEQEKGVRLVFGRSSERKQPPRQEPPQRINLTPFFWLAVCPFLAIALLAACLPPGVLWIEEGQGYDVLEYHLAVPKTFHDQGRITFLPNNVYANFPLNSEMLSLLMMTLRGDAIEAAFMAKMVNVALAGLFVAASWLAGSTFSPRAGMLTGVLAATLPWTAYLAGIAFVEVGMLAMGMCSAAAILPASREPDRSSRSLLTAGLLAGLACGYKYTAVTCIALPLALLPLASRGPWPKRLNAVLLFVAGAALTFAPWLVRNAVNTGNPVFPLAYSVFGANARTWDNALEARWQHAHGPAGAGDPDTPAGKRLLDRTIRDHRMGVVVFLLAAIGAIVHRDRWTFALTIMLVWQAVFWLMFTHHYARFAVVMLLPLLVLAARTLEDVPFPAMYRLVWTLLIVGAGWNLYQIGRLYYDHTRPRGRAIEAYGCTNWFVQGDWPGTRHVGAINALEPDARVMLVGEARSFYFQHPCEYAVVFNHHPLADAVRRFGENERSLLEWLRERGTTHVLVHWGEMRRLRESRYGFYPQIDRELFERLTKAGLIKSSEWGPEHRLRATLYEVPQDE